MYITAEIARAHCNAGDDVPASLLTLYTESAERSVAKYLGVDLATLLLTAGDNTTLPADVQHAILLYIANAVSNRETIIVGTIFAELPTATRLLQPYRSELGV